MKKILCPPFNILPVFSCVLLLILSGCSDRVKTKTIYLSSEKETVLFGIEELSSALAEKGCNLLSGTREEADFVVEVGNKYSEIKKEGFRIDKMENKQIRVQASDNAGAMYGLMELGEQIKLYGFKGITEVQKDPYMALRGMKFNIPLDIRTPTYTDPCDATLMNIEVMWDLEFWKDYIDNMARYRYNYVSLWSLHPFPSMVKVPGYEDVALDNVERSVTKWKEFYSANATDLTLPEIVNNTEILKKISIDEKIEFWKKVMAYGKARNIDFYIVTWNIFVNGTNGKYGITEDINNDITRDYFRKTIKQMFITYPDLKGIGLTTGENMHGANLMEKEDWAFDAYARGLMDVAKEMPERDFTFIHRQHQTGAKDIAEKFKPLIDQPNVNFIFSFKYAKAHVMSATTQPYHEAFVKDIEGMKTIWTLRNDDNYIYRWGAPDFVREFIQNIPYEVSMGYYYGSDQWVWGKEFLDKNSQYRKLEIVKHWYHYTLWGRLGYDPSLDNQRLIDILNNKFPETDAEGLFAAWQNASMIYPVTTGFHWGSLDFQWYIEGCKSRPGYAQNNTGFHDVNRFINLPPHVKSGFQSIPEFVKNINKPDNNSGKKSPLQVAQLLNHYADNALNFVEAQGKSENKELAVTLHDIRTMATLGKYYALKIEGAVNLAIYRDNKDKGFQAEAVEKLENALEVWKKYVTLSEMEYKNPLWTNRVGYVDWKNLTQWVEDDIAIAKDDGK